MPGLPTRVQPEVSGKVQEPVPPLTTLLEPKSQSPELAMNKVDAPAVGVKVMPDADADKLDDPVNEADVPAPDNPPGPENDHDWRLVVVTAQITIEHDVAGHRIRSDHIVHVVCICRSVCRREGEQ